VEFEKDPHNSRYHQWTDSHLTVCRESEELPWNSAHKLLFLSNDGDVWTDSGTIQDKHVLDLNYSYSSESFQFPFLSSDFVRPCQILKTNVTANTFDVVYFLHSWQIPASRRISNLSYGTSSDETLGEIALELAKLKIGSSTGALDAASPARALVYINGLHREHIGLISKPLSADCLDPRACRHDIHIADHSFPDMLKVGEPLQNPHDNNLIKLNHFRQSLSTKVNRGHDQTPFDEKGRWTTTRNRSGRARSRTQPLLRGMLQLQELGGVMEETSPEWTP
jgi:hypothetical protein